MECVHHWKLASPNGHTSIGVCKHCGAERQFPNSDDYSVWTDDAHVAAAPSKKAQALEATEVNRVVW